MQDWVLKSDYRRGNLCAPPHLLCFLFLALLLTAATASGEEPELGSLPIFPNPNCLVAPSLILSGWQLQQTADKPDTIQPKSPASSQSGTSNDRILWTLPNFLTLENADNISPLTPKQKFAVTARGVFDPFEFVLIGFVAGINQASDSNPTYGGGMRGYAKRYGTAYGDNAIENFMSSAVFPTILHQDPRYYQMGHGGFFRRTEHAVSRVLFTRSDSGEKQLNYSELGGAITAAAISDYTYHPHSDRGFTNVLTVWGSQMGWDAVTYMIKEFWPDLRKRKSRAAHDMQLAPQTPENSEHGR
jgi:hypothetical protein